MAQQAYLMGIDIGTTTSKGVIVTPEGKILASAGFEHDISRPFPDWAEHDADGVWWSDFVQVCRTLLAQSGVKPSSISAVGYSTMYPALVPVDQNGNPLRSGILYGIDRRALEEIHLLRQQLGEEYCLRTSGNGLSTQSIAPKILWLKRREPEVFAAAHKYLNASAYLAYRLTGRYCMDHGSASLGGVPYCLERSDWDDDTLEVIGISREQLPELIWADEPAGRVSRKAAEETGLAPGTLIAPGTGDHVAECLSQGYIQPGAASISYGTTFGTDVCVDRLMTCPGLSTSLTCFQGLYTLGGGMLNGCSLTRWFRDNLACFDKEELAGPEFDPYEQLDIEAAQVPAGCDGLIALPYFAGEKIPFFNPHARGVLFGLSLRHTREHIYRALMESVAFSVRHTLSCVRGSGLEVEQVISTGGGARGKLWPQIVSDVTGLTQQVLKPSHGSPMGAAFLGALAAGVVTDRRKILEWNETDRWVRPEPENEKQYDEYYQIFLQLYEKTEALMERL
ncbi:MAG: FGGY-family carbohydrate kinase [Oscillospiraceae bacterium]|nr:FGGY-family carbohydrate kinase [Oscillospiraceae bacterium]